MTSPASPSPAGTTPSSEIKEVVKRLNGSTEKLETSLEQALQALRKRGFQLSTDLSGIVRLILQDISLVQKGVTALSAQQEQMGELVRILGLVNSSLDMEQVLEDVMDTVIALTGAERAYLLMRNEGSNDLVLRQARNWHEKNIEQDEVVFSRSIVNAAMEQKQPILTTNAQTDDRFQGMQSVFSHSLRSIICIPLVRRNEITGVLYADNRIGQGVFSQDLIPLLQAFGNQAALAIENARAFTQAKADLAQAQKEVINLRIQIDQQKMQEQIGEITDTEFFQNLQAQARLLRTRARVRRPDDLKDKDPSVSESVPDSGTQTPT